MNKFTDPNSAEIPFDWNNSDLWKEPDPVSRPDQLSYSERYELLRTLGNVDPSNSNAEQSETVKAYRRLKPDDAALAHRETQNLRLEQNLARGFETNPVLINLAQNYERLTNAEVSQSLREVLKIQNDIYEGGGARQVTVFEDRRPYAVNGEQIGGTVQLNLVEHDGRRKPLNDLLETLIHENRHVHQAWLGENHDKIPDSDPRKSYAEIFKLYSEIRLNHNPGRNDNIAYSVDPKEIDANNAGAVARSSRIATVIEQHAETGRSVAAENARRFAAPLSTPEIPVDWNKIATEMPKLAEPEDIWTRAARQAETEAARLTAADIESHPARVEIDQQRTQRFQEARAEWFQPGEQRNNFAFDYAAEFNRLASGRFLQDTLRVSVDANHPQSSMPASPQVQAEFERAATHNGEFRARGAAMGVSGYGLATRLSGQDQNYNADIAAGGERAVYARAGMAADVAGFAGDALESTTSLTGRAANVARSLASPQVIKFAGRAAIPLALTAGGFEMAAAFEEGNAERAAGAFGSTLGGLAAGAAGGAIVGTMGGGPIGTVAGGIIGGIGGAIVGEKVAKKTMTETMAGIMGKKPANGEETTGYRIGRGIRSVGNGVSAGYEFAKKHPVVLAAGPLAPVAAMAGAALTSDTGQRILRGAKEGASNLINNSLAAAGNVKNNIVSFFGGKPERATPASANGSSQSVEQRLKPALDGLNKNASWVRHMDRDGDGKISQTELNRSLRGHGLNKFSQVDANHDGRVSAQEMSRGLNRAIAEERREIAIDRRGMDRMTADQLRQAIREDNVLPDKIKVNGREMDIRDALKNPNTIDRYADMFEAKHLRGDGDFSKQVAMLRELQERQSGQMVQTRVGPAVTMGMSM